MPVESMSMRVMMGIVQALLSPGISAASFSASVNSSCVRRRCSTVRPWDCRDLHECDAVAEALADALLYDFVNDGFRQLVAVGLEAVENELAFDELLQAVVQRAVELLLVIRRLRRILAAERFHGGPGVGEVLKARKPSVKIVAVEPDASPVLSGGQPGPHKLQGIGPGFIPQVLNTKIYDEVIRVKETDSGPVSKQVNKLDGIPIGISSGAATWAALQLAKRPENKGKQIVVIIPSSSERYLSTWLFADINVESDSVEDLIGAVAPAGA